MKNKKNIIFGVLVVIIIALILTIVGVIYLKNNKKYQGVVDLSMATLNEKIANKEDFIMVITQTTCSHCKAFLPILESVAKDYNVTFYDMNITNLQEDERNELSKIVNFTSTPTTIFFKNGEEESTTTRLVGEKSQSQVVTRLKNEGFINE